MNPNRIAIAKLRAELAELREANEAARAQNAGLQATVDALAATVAPAEQA